MDAKVATDESRATNATPNIGNELSIALTSGSDPDAWFYEAARDLLGKDAGLHLHYATGVPERSCYRYASGEREVPVLMLRAILHSDQGAPFLAALMHGCAAQWWIEFQNDADVGRDVIAIVNRGK